MHITVQMTGDIAEIAHVLMAATRVGLKVDETETAAVVETEEAKEKRKRRTKAEIEAAKAANAASPVATVVAPAVAAAPAQTAPAGIPTDAEVQAALVAVNDKHGIEKALECLTKFGVKRGRELKDEQKRPFLELCQSMM